MKRRMMSKRQPSLPGFPDVPDELEIRIPTDMPWTQISGDMDPGSYGGLIATADGDHIELLEIQPVREHVGDEEAAEVGFPFWTKEAWFDLADLDLKNKNVQSALQFSGFDSGDQKYWFEEEATPEERALVIAEALIQWGRGDEGPSGWSSDLYDYEVKWSSRGEIIGLREFLADVDDEFKNDVLGYSDIREKLEEEVQRQVDESAAQGWSDVGDQMMLDAERAGFDPQSVSAIAEFGDAVAINGTVETEKTMAGLETDLEAEGLEQTDFGGQVPSVEGYAYAEHVIRTVADEMGVPAETVEDAAQGIDWWPTGQGDGGEIPGSTSGYASIWAKRLNEEEEVEEAPRRRAGASGVETLPVLFRAERSGEDKGDVTAVFPTLQGTGPNDFQVYSHVGQHSTGTRGWYNETRAATPAEYTALLAELRRIYEHGPNAVQLQVVQRFTRDHDAKRRYG